MKNLQEFVDLPKVFDSNSVQLLLLFFLRRNPLHANAEIQEDSELELRLASKLADSLTDLSI